VGDDTDLLRLWLLKILIEEKGEDRMLEVLGVSLYLMIAVLCGILMIAMFLLGDFTGDMDVDVDMGGHAELGFGDADVGLSPLSLPIMLMFGTSFGAFGYIFESLEFNPYVVPVIAIGISAVIAAVMYVMVLKIFVQTQTSSDIRLHNLVGEDAIVSIPIKEGSIGQIIVTTEERGRTILSAVSDEEIPNDTIVTITKVMGDGVFVNKKKLSKD
jgi:membrane protein implicated in regulation of membrane protease activity